MLVELKIMTIAEVELGALENQEIFMRCDYRVIKMEETPLLEILKDTITPLPTELQEFVLQLHNHCLNKGLKYTVETKGFWIFFKYSLKRKEVLGINTSLNNGYQINVKAADTDKYIEIIDQFPLVMKEVIKRVPLIVI